MSFLHGVETIPTSKGATPFALVRSAVIAIVGIAPKGPRQALTLCLSDADDAQFGARVPGFNIPEALALIRAQEEANATATVVVVNVLDNAKHLTAVTSEANTVTGSKFKLAYAPIADLVLTKDGGGTAVLGTDYTVDDYGTVSIPAGSTIVEGSTVTAAYKRLNPSSVVAADILGAVEAETNVRTGFELLDLAQAAFGFKTKVLISPGYTLLSGVASKMRTKANKYRGFYLVDAPVGMTPQQAITARGPLGATPALAVSDKRLIACYPLARVYDPATDALKNVPYSSIVAGLIAVTHAKFGFWFSPSNQPIRGVEGMERQITADISDASTEANQLNAVGYLTVFSAYGTGLLTWGNRNGSFPANQEPDSFIPVVALSDTIYDTIERNMLPFMDKPLSTALLDDIRESVNAFLRELQQRGAIIGGSCSYKRQDNPASQLAKGQAVFEYEFAGAVAGERYTFRAVYNKELYETILEA